MFGKFASAISVRLPYFHQYVNAERCDMVTVCMCMAVCSISLAFLPPAPPTEAVLEFECKSQERAALSNELRTSRQASRVYVVKGKPWGAVKSVLLIRAPPCLCEYYCGAPPLHCEGLEACTSKAHPHVYV